MSQPIVIAGATGGAPNRLEINDFVKNVKFFSLYVQALQLMYDAHQDADDLSFFRIAGIHGLPYEPWNGVGEKPIDPETRWAGYCVHGSTLFPTWHRPYLALFEQRIQQQAKKVAETYEVDKEQWLQAAENIRQPYWDFARNAVPPPEVISLTSVPITAPDGTRKTVPNPLNHYKFHPTPDYFQPPLNRMTRTYRRPRGTINNPSDDVTRLTQILQQQFSSTRRNTYNMLTIVRTWAGFANHTVEDGGSVANSVEAIHDNLHVALGGSGHMSDPGVAAFDPIFWLLHTNVDRLLSLWSALHPGVWVSPGDAEVGSLMLEVEERVDENTSLTPFWKTDTTFWASAGLQDTVPQGYSYPEFNGLDLSNPQTVQHEIAAIVNRLYSPRSTRGFEVATAAPEPSLETVSASLASAPVMSKSRSISREVVVEKEEAQAPVAAPPPLAQIPIVSFAAVTATANPASEVPSTIVPDHGLNSGLWDWTAHVKFKHFELNGSFSVIFFLGPVPEDHTTWETAPNTIGVRSAFVNRSAARCGNCVARSDMLEEGCVPLDDGIIKHSGLTHLGPETVVPYLTENLNWRVVMVSDETTEVELPSLEVTVRAIPLSYPEGADFPIAGEGIPYPDITSGKVGGSRE